LTLREARPPGHDRPIRVLFSCDPGTGHLHPLVPLARALAGAGHEVAFATAASLAGRLEALGFPLLPAGLDEAERQARFEPYRAEQQALPIAERRSFTFTRMFATVAARAKAGELHAVAVSWRPDLIVHESADLAAPVVAAALDIPIAHQSFGRMVPLAAIERGAKETEALWRDAGLEPEPYGGMFRGLYLDICPPSFQTELPPAGTRVKLLQPTFDTDPGARAPSWLAELPDRPLVYVTLGTVHNDLQVFRVLLPAVEGLDCNVVVTIGRGNDPAELGRVPANVVVERYVPQSLLLPHAALTVTHGGSGSTLAALGHGLPMLVVPRGADQFDNARRVAMLGAGLVLLPAELTVETARAAVVALLAEGSYRERAQRVASEIAAMPPAEALVPVLEALAGSPAT
jgi:UDP:flavonoid glycosyltransferase YjiC (YdhE family)